MYPEHVPIFPLNSPLLPACQLPLQIFEKRYLDMVSHCLRTDGSFVITLLRPGLEQHEVITPDLQSTDNVPFYTVGTEARIVDFGQRSNGLLAITIAGQQRVNLSDIYQDKNGLWRASIKPRPEQRDSQETTQEEWADLLEQILGFGGLQAIRNQVDLTSAEQVMNYLIMLLPMPAETKQALTEKDSHAERLRQLGHVLTLLATPAKAQPGR